MASQLWIAAMALLLLLNHLAAASPGEAPEQPLMKTNFTGYDMSLKFRYLGCFSPGRYLSEMPHSLLHADMSTERCYMHCMDNGHRFFGTQGQVCNCGSTYGTAGQLPESSCNHRCDLAPAQKCGGDDGLSVYAIIEKFSYLGCFAPRYRSDGDRMFVSDSATKLACSLRCQRELAPFFGMLAGRQCACLFSVDLFVQQLERSCLSLCLEVDTVGCGVGDKMSVYSIEYEMAVENVLGSRMGFLGVARQYLLTVKSATLFGILVGSGSKLYVRAHYEDGSGSGNYSGLVGDSPGAVPAPCPDGWLSFSIRNGAEGSSSTAWSVRPGYRCYLAVAQARNWTGALQQCWAHDSDLYYQEDDSEAAFLAAAGLGNMKYWIGMYYSTVGVYKWLEDSSANRHAGRQTMPAMGATERACVQQTPGSIQDADVCSMVKPFLCKRYSSLYTSWNAQLPAGIPLGRRVALKVFETGAAAPLLQLTLNLTTGSHVAAIASHGGSRLHYSVIERVPLKMCHQWPTNGPAQHYRCSEPGNETPRYQFGQFTCANARRLQPGAKWTEPLGDWVEDVTYHVTEVQFLNRLNLTESSLTLTSETGAPCQRMSSASPAWVKFACNANLKGLVLTSAGNKYPYIYMCDLQVQGYLVQDKSKLEHTGLFKPSDRVLGLRMLGVFGRGRRGGASEDSKWVDDLYLKAFHKDKLLRMFHARHTDHFAMAVAKSASSQDLVLFNQVDDRSNDVRLPTRTCSVSLVVGQQRCMFSDSSYLLINVTERANLINCQQSSQLAINDYCENAINLLHGESHRLGRCAQTRVSAQPWWRARVYSTFLFEHIVLYSVSGRNLWTTNFQVLIEKRVCVSVANGTGFVKGEFDCGLSGTDVTVQALGWNMALNLCEIIAYGHPGGCGAFRRHPTEPCQGELRSHVGYREQPYEGAQRCQWVIGGAAEQTVLLTFPEFRTAGPNDYVAVYEGAGTAGRRLATFYGNAEHKPKLPRKTLSGVTNFVLGRLSQLTLEFVTEKPSPTAPRRTVESHLGFRSEFQLTHNDYFYEHQSDLDPICEETMLTTLLFHYCFNRGGVHPVVTHGSKTGNRMYREMEDTFLRQQGVTSSAPRSKRDLSQDTVRDYYCTNPEAIATLPHYMQSCCCRPCNVKFMIGLCLRKYAALVDSVCALNVTRLI